MNLCVLCLLCALCIELAPKSGKRDSNSRPQPWQGCALPTELFPQYAFQYFNRGMPTVAKVAPPISLLGQGCALPTELFPQKSFSIRKIRTRFAKRGAKVALFLLPTNKNEDFFEKCANPSCFCNRRSYIA